MAVNPRRSDEESTEDEYESETNTSSVDELASALEREKGEMMIIRALQHFVEPIFVPIFRPWIRQIVEERFGLPKHESLATMKENLANDTSTSVLKKLMLKFRNRIALPVLTGMPLLAENQTPIEIALVDALTGQIVNTGTASSAKLEIMGFRDDGSIPTVHEFQERIMRERTGRRILQGNTCLQLNKGVGRIHSRISFTHNSKHTKNGMYRLGAIVVDADLMNGVEVAWTETFLMKDQRSKYNEKHPKPFLSDNLCHLEHICSKGTRFKHLKREGVMTVKDLLALLYTDQKRLEDILEVKASSKIWNDIVQNAQSSNGMLLYLDPSNERKTGVVLNVKLQLMGLIVEPLQYIPVDDLSDKKKIDSQILVKCASKHFEMLKAFEDETSIKAYLESGSGFISSDHSLGTCKITDEPTTTYSQVTYSSSGLNGMTKSINNANFHLSQNTNDSSMVTSQSVRGKEKAPIEDETVHSKYYVQEYLSSHPPNMEGLNELNFETGTAHNITEPGTSFQAVNPLSDTCGLMNTYLNDNFGHCSKGWEQLEHLINYNDNSESLNNEWHFNTENSDADVVTRISPSHGSHKKQRFC